MQICLNDIKQLTGYNANAFFSSYIEGVAFLPIEQITDLLGLQYDVFGYEDVNLSIAKNSHLRKSILGF